MSRYVEPCASPDARYDGECVRRPECGNVCRFAAEVGGVADLEPAMCNNTVRLPRQWRWAVYENGEHRYSGATFNHATGWLYRGQGWQGDKLPPVGVFDI
jgi:hypothetical protein